MPCKFCHGIVYTKPRVLYLDTEVSASLGAYYPPRYDTNILWTEQEWRFLCFSYAWDDSKVQNVHNANEKKMVMAMRELIDQCDLLVCHNVAYDLGKFYAKCLEYQIPPPRPFKTFCTLMKYRRLAKFESNKLGDLGEKLGFGDKVELTGKKFWRQVMAGDKKSIKKMIIYCNKDVTLLRHLHKTISPFFPPMRFKIVK